MKTKSIWVCAGSLAVMFATTWLVGCTMRVEDSGKPTAHDSVVVDPVVPTVVTPSANFDLEVTNPAIAADASGNAMEIESPAPELTWYDPHRLESVGSTS